MSRGILMFGLNNETIDYFKLCIINAKLIKKNMGDISISVVTSAYSLSWDWAKENREEIDALVSLIVLDGTGGLNNLDEAANKRQYRDTQYFQKQDVFLNKRRSDAFSLSPYDETLLIDCDYLILSDSLNSVWGNVEDFLIAKSAIQLNHEKFNSTEWRLNPYGLRMFWATIIYFQKTERARLVFDLVEHIKTNWRFYSLTYDFPAGLYRNDFSFSIAIHMLSGFQDNDDFKSIPDAPLLTSLDRDQFIKMLNPKELITYVKNLSDDWSFSLQRVNNVNVHIMNKIALLNNADKIFEAIK